MLKQISKIKLAIFKILEEELLTVLAVCLVMLGVWFTKAATNINLGFVILDSGTLTVTAPNGGEDWQIDSSQHITWTSTGSVANVKIELQRTISGSWETLVASTVNDGDYPWPVTAPDSTTATVRISSVTVPGITDNSDAVFIISAASVVTPPNLPSGGGGGGNVSPRIDSVDPSQFTNGSAVNLKIIGYAFDWNSEVYLGGVKLTTKVIHLNSELLSTVPAGFKPGSFDLCVVIPNRTAGCYVKKINVLNYLLAPPSTGGAGEEYSAMLVRQFSLKPANGVPLQTGQKLVGQSPDITLKPRETATLWAEFKNTGTATWYQDGKNPVRLGTDAKRDRSSAFYHSSWIKKNRPVLVNKVVKPGEIGRFEFTIQAPWTAKTYTEYFKPVVEWKTWMNGQSQVKWVVTVQSQSFWKTLFQKPIAPTTKPAVPSTGGKVELPFQPKDTLFFSDNIEKIYQKATQVITGFLSKLSK